MTLKIEIRGDEEVIKKFKKLGEDDLNKARERWLTESAIILQGESKKLAPVDSGILRKSIKYEVKDTYATVYTNLSYAPFVHEGTKPHIILPKFKKALHWIDKKSGEDRFATSVLHPGYKGNPFFTKAVDNQRNKIISRFYEIINGYIND